MGDLNAELELEAELEAEQSSQHERHSDLPALESSIPRSRTREGFAESLPLAPHAAQVSMQDPMAEGNDEDDPDHFGAAEESYEPAEAFMDLGHIPSEWELRSRRQYEDRCNGRPLYFGLGILKEAPPEAGTLCMLCNDREARLRCLDCTSQGPLLLCGFCDILKHPYAHFHRREGFGNGFWQREAPSLAFSDGEGQYERGKDSCAFLMVYIHRCDVHIIHPYEQKHCALSQRPRVLEQVCASITDQHRATIAARQIGVHHCLQARR